MSINAPFDLDLRVALDFMSCGLVDRVLDDGLRGTASTRASLNMLRTMTQPSSSLTAPIRRRQRALGRVINE
jgi:hypothetical protein